MKLKILLITIVLFVGCAGVYGQTVFLFSFENTEAVTTDNAVGTPTFAASGVDTPNYFGGSTGDSRSHANWQTGDYYRFTVNTTGYSSLNFSYFSRSSDAAVGTFIARVSTDASNWTTIISSYTPTTTFAQRIAALPAGFANQAVVYIEVYKTNNADIINRNIRIDEVLLTGTVSADVTPPTVTTFNPADNATGVAINSNLVLTFDENVVVGTAGDIVIYNASDNSVFETIPYNNGKITYNGTTGVTINPSGTFANSASYYVQIGNAAIRDVALNNYAGISNTTTWNFTTEAIWTNPITDSNPSTANPYTIGQTFNANITVSGISRGSGIADNPGGNRYNANDWNSGSLNPNDYFEFTLTPNAGYEINFIDFVYTSERSGNNGSEWVDNFAFRSSVSNYTTNIGTPDFDGTTISLSDAAYQNRTTATTFRIYAWGADAAGRTFSINDFTFNGTVIQTTLATDYFRSRLTGVWATASNWESSRDNTNWITSTLAPTSVANTITIRDTHTITISGAVTADQITVLSGGTLALNGADLTLNDGTGTDLTIASGGTFDNGGESQITRFGTPSISISGTFITRDEQGFVGPTTAIPDISTTLNTGSTIEYGRAGNQAVQGSIISTYQNITISGSGTKTLASTIPIAGTILTKDSAIFDVGSNTFGIGSTPLIMQGTSTYKVGGSDVKPDAGGLYTLATGTTMEFTGTSATQIRVAPIYANLVVSGTNVKAGSTDDAGLTFQNPGTFTVKNGAVFKVTNTTGFTGSLTAAIKNTSNPTITLEPGSTVEYSGANQSITTVPVSNTYANLTVSGTGIKTIPTQLFVGNNLAVNASTLQIESNKTLIVTNNVVVNAAATMTLETNTFNQSASLVQINDAAINSGTVTYRRNSTGGEKDYTYWSTPVAGQTLLAVSPFTKLDKFFSFDSVANDWLQANPSNEMIIGKGYIIRGIPPPPFPALPPGFTTASFIGTPNNGIHKISGVVADKPYLLGNPYPCALNAEKFLNSNSGVLDGTLYFWTHYTAIQDRNLIVGNDQFGNPKVGTGILAYTSDDYASYNAVGGVAAGDGVIPNGRIGAGQGFFASSNATIIGTNEIIFNNSMRLSSDTVPVVLNNSQFFKTRNPISKTEIFEKHRIWLNLTNSEGVFKQILVGYLTDATNQYDSRFDGETFDGNEFADFYSVNQDKNLVIQGRALPFDKNDQVPLGFRTTIDGAFTINIDQADGVLTNQAVFIEDKLTNTIFDLRTGPYTFTTKSGTFNDRFVLRYTNKTLGTIDLETLENQVLVSNKNKQIQINSNTETIDKIMVYDLLGRLLFKKDKVNSNEFSILNLISNLETLLVKVTLQNGQTVTKKIIY